MMLFDCELGKNTRRCRTQFRYGFNVQTFDVWNAISMSIGWNVEQELTMTFVLRLDSSLLVDLVRHEEVMLGCRTNNDLEIGLKLESVSIWIAISI